MGALAPSSDHPVLLLGASGSIGRAVHAALIARGWPVVAPLRAPADLPPASSQPGIVPLDPAGLGALMTRHRPWAVISCLASRSGAPEDAWAVDHALNSAALRAAVAAGVGRFVLLSAICVQKPRLAFQRAKLAFEAELQAAPVTWSIVRPTAYFKSLSGQMGRLRAGKPYLLFGDGALTACKPLSDRDLAAYLLSCLDDPARHNRILPIGGPGPALTPRAMGQMMFEALGLAPRFRQVPLALMKGISGGLSLAARALPALRAKAEFGRIGLYYAQESMLVWDPARACYDADATPETGQDRLLDHYHALARGRVQDDRGAHALF